MEKEYIPREAAIASLCCDCSATGDCRPGERCVDYQRLKEIPAADVVHVVRCDECKWSDNYGLDLMCQKHSGIMKSKLGEDIHFVEWHSKNFFCSDGERKDGDRG